MKRNVVDTGIAPPDANRAGGAKSSGVNQLVAAT